jgi:hypothetical protein
VNLFVYTGNNPLAYTDFQGTGGCGGIDVSWGGTLMKNGNLVGMAGRVCHDERSRWYVIIVKYSCKCRGVYGGGGIALAGCVTKGCSDVLGRGRAAGGGYPLWPPIGVSYSWSDTVNCLEIGFGAGGGGYYCDCNYELVAQWDR